MRQRAEQVDGDQCGKSICRQCVQFPSHDDRARLFCTSVGNEKNPKQLAVYPAAFAFN
ncbi:hypothetical protein [Burkholderia diffusa]|uniref:hypothetical protein n=1 Tax=Burkholderia diffusa TaxID=488732 RepID=UPI000AB9DA7B|nr:hypothetical protein [Burkholderia diffusa]